MSHVPGTDQAMPPSQQRDDPDRPPAGSTTRRLTGAQILVEYLVAQGVPYAAGIPGHGCWNLTDALLDSRTGSRTIQVMHEQSAVHLADGYYRATGRPMLAFTSIGPGQMNTVVGMATAYADSTAVLLMTGSAHTYMRGHGLLQEFERRHAADNSADLRAGRQGMVAAVARRRAAVRPPSGVEPDALRAARGPSCSTCRWTSRPTPPTSSSRPSSARRAAARARPPTTSSGPPACWPRPRRPVIVAGGGAITADASAELTALAERLGAPVVTTWKGKGAIDETHELNAWSVGDTASTSGNRLAATADVLVSVGCRFTDWSSSSWRRGVTFAIPPSRLIQIDIDPREIGKNYPVEVGLVGDARAALADLLEALGPGGGPAAYRSTGYFEEIQTRKAEWEDLKRVKQRSAAIPMTQARALFEVQARDRAGCDRGHRRRVCPSRSSGRTGSPGRPRTHLTSGGFSTMGFTLPAAIGAKLARPDRQVLGIAGDGDFLQTMQELATAAMLDLPVVFVVLNNSGWISIKGGQARTSSGGPRRPTSCAATARSTRPTTGRSVPPSACAPNTSTSPTPSAPRSNEPLLQAGRRSSRSTSPGTSRTRASTRPAGGTRRSPSSIPTSTPRSSRGAADRRRGEQRR